MDTSLSLAVIAGLLLVNTVFIVAALVRAMRTMGEAQRFIEMARLQLAPLSHDVTQIISDVRSIVRGVEREFPKIGDSLTAVRDTTRNLREFESMIQERIERPLLDVTAVLSALVRGSRVFWHNFKKDTT
ncbi:MAG: DUF948 domain-containing protein [Calditrichaeota bacterium]|nr:MAG: DUF948 domain-containing protein [Calditrichota bacterium]